MNRNYDDMIYMEHPKSRNHPPMPIKKRAAQFAPFAALSGHNEAVRETERLTDQRIELDETEKQRLDAKFLLIEEHLSTHPDITITYFLPDRTKEGGKYQIILGKIKKMDPIAKRIVLMDGEEIPIEDVIDIDAEFLKGWD